MSSRTRQFDHGGRRCHRGLAAALGGAVLLVSSGAAGVGLAGGAAAAAPPAFRTVDLHAAYEAALPHVKHEPITGITYAIGRAPKRRAATAAGCSEPQCPLTWNGGPVQHSPHVYLLLWGPDWTTDQTAEAVGTYLAGFYAGLGGEPADNWSTITAQYSDGAGVPTFGSSVFMGTFNDQSTPPVGIDDGGLAAEADAFTTTQDITDIADAQIVVATQSGTCPQDFAGSTCGGTPEYCAWHSYSNEPFTNLPYLLDAGASCGEDAVQAQDDGFSIVGGHEYAETITDPEPDSGWIDFADNGGGEIGDKCAWTDLGTVTLDTGNFAVQPLFSNAAYHATGNGCVLTGRALAPGTSSIRMSISGSPASFGREQYLRFAVTVQSKDGGTPTGSVIVTVYGHPVHLSDGRTVMAWTRPICAISTWTCRNKDVVAGFAPISAQLFGRGKRSAAGRALGLSEVADHTIERRRGRSIAMTDTTLPFAAAPGSRTSS